ncbi:hypothetical protein TYRP_010288 [Tyrophagus putrescentiae]|nr:hypothetical protein TYRP_010288 [Tyrophagus putrescentiae]
MSKLSTALHEDLDSPVDAAVDKVAEANQQQQQLRSAKLLRDQQINPLDFVDIPMLALLLIDQLDLLPLKEVLLLSDSGSSSPAQLQLTINCFSFSSSSFDTDPSATAAGAMALGSSVLFLFITSVLVSCVKTAKRGGRIVSQCSAGQSYAAAAPVIVFSTPVNTALPPPMLYHLLNVITITVIENQQ